MSAFWTGLIIGLWIGAIIAICAVALFIDNRRARR